MLELETRYTRKQLRADMLQTPARKLQEPKAAEAHCAEAPEDTQSTAEDDKEFVDTGRLLMLEVRVGSDPANGTVAESN